VQSYPETRAEFSSLSELASLRLFIENYANQVEVDESTRYDIQLAATELVTNALVHGYRSQNGWVEVVLQRIGPEFHILLRDRAPAFDPTQVRPPHLNVPFEQRGFGGWGIYLACQSAHSMNYDRLPAGINQVRLVFAIIDKEMSNGNGN